MRKVCIVYPTDPFGEIPGGIETFISGLIRWAPPDFAVDFVGITTDTVRRPVGRWSDCEIDGRQFRYYPVLAMRLPYRRPRIPMALQFVLKLLQSRPSLDADLLEFHRLEPVLPLLKSRIPMTCVVHQFSGDLLNRGSDIRWKYLPWLFFGLERIVIPRLEHVFCVRSDAVDRYQSNFPERAERISFVPTWVDPEVFRAAQADTAEERRTVRRELDLPEHSEVIISVGRLDSQKDPMLALDTFASINADRPDTSLVLVGDGPLRASVERRIDDLGLSDSVCLAGLRPREGVARLLRNSDLFLLTSAYEGMPMAVLEGLRSGVPVVSTDVGEVGRVIIPGKNGEIVASRSSKDIARAALRVLGDDAAYDCDTCIQSVDDYLPEKIVAGMYAKYRQIISSTPIGSSTAEPSTDS